MRILMFSWKDIKNPAAGGAEVFTWQILRELAHRGHKVTLFASRYTLEVPSFETIDGVEIHRAGGRFGVYLWAVYYYFRYFRGRLDVVIDQINTVPFFTPFYVREKKIALVPQLARVIWFYETRFPFSLIGYLLEPIFLQVYRRIPIVTISSSSQKDLQRFGLTNSSIVPVALSLKPLESLDAKPEGLKVVFLGRLVPGKKALEALLAFGLVKANLPAASLSIVGRGTVEYQERLAAKVKELGLLESVRFVRNAPDEQRNAILREAFVVLVPSTKEGWGLVVTEANSQGTPAVVYNVDGLRDSVRDGITGLVCGENTPAELARFVLELYGDRELYERIRRQAWEESKKYTIEKTVAIFEGILKGLDPERV